MGARACRMCGAHGAARACTLALSTHQICAAAPRSVCVWRCSASGSAVRVRLWHLCSGLAFVFVCCFFLGWFFECVLFYPSQVAALIQDERMGRVCITDHQGGGGDARNSTLPGGTRANEMQNCTFSEFLSTHFLPRACHAPAAGRRISPRQAHRSGVNN